MAEDGPGLDITQLVADYHQPLYRYAYRLTGSTADAEDLAQQVFLIAQQKLRQLRQSKSVRSWLFAILRNCYLKSFRHRGPLSLAASNFDIESVPEKVLDQQVDSEQLQLAINELPEEFKLVVLMFYFEQRSYREIAETLQIPAGTVMSRLSRAKGHLRQRLFVPDAPAACADAIAAQRMKISSRPVMHPR